MSVAGLVLAAGSGSRLGTAKAVVELDGVRLVDRAVAVLRSGGCEPLLVVLGAIVVEVPGAAVVVNPQWDTGMGSSLRAGLAAAGELPAEVTAVLVGLVDQPRIGAEVIARLIAAHRAGAAVAVAAYASVRGNPVLLARDTWPEVARLAVGDQGARAFLKGNPGLVVAVECADLGDPDDIDTREDLHRHRRENPDVSDRA